MHFKSLFGLLVILKYLDDDRDDDRNMSVMNNMW